MTKSNFPHIAIVGSGLAGLTAACILQLHDVKFRLFEAASSSTSDQESNGSVRLHTAAGQEALRLANLLDDAQALARNPNQSIRLLDASSSSLIFEENSSRKDENLDIGLAQLRALLLGTLRPSTVLWDHKLHKLRNEGHERWIEFDNGISYGPFALVIGADGAWSSVRENLTKSAPFFTGITRIDFRIENLASRYPVLADVVGHGLMWSLANGTGLFAEQSLLGNLNTCAIVRQQLSGTIMAGARQGFSPLVKKAVLDSFAEWSPRLRSLIAQSDEFVSVRPIYASPLNYKWLNVPGLTLIGDAAYLWPPLAFGADLAMQEAAELAGDLVRDNDLNHLVAKHEERMMTRILDAAPKKLREFLTLIGEDAPDMMLAQLRQDRSPAFEY